MFHFVIGLGISSVSGADIERMLLQRFEPDIFFIHPIHEPPYAKDVLPSIQLRTIHYANEVKLRYPAKFHLGVASGIAWRREDEKKGSYVRYDMSTFLEKDAQGLTTTSILNHAHLMWQLKNRVYHQVSSEESVARLSILIQKICEKIPVEK